MSDQIFLKLRESINQYSTGFRTTESGVELKILELLFTKSEAEMYMQLTETLQTARQISEKAGLDFDETDTTLKKMTEKGLTFPKIPDEQTGDTFYAAAPWVHGIVEHQLKRMDREMAELLEQFLLEGWNSRPTISLRNIPVQRTIEDSRTIAPYDDIREIIRNKTKICLTDCVCRVWQSHLEKDYPEPIEVCMLFDFYADYYVKQDLGRFISVEEALQKLDECEKAGLVPQVSNSKSPEALCNCHPHACGQIRLLKQLPIAGLISMTNYFAVLDDDSCTGCEACIDRCSMDALTMADGLAQLDLNRCIGCGLCVTVCSPEALTLEEKTPEKHLIPPDDGIFMRPSKIIEDSAK